MLLKRVASWGERALSDLYDHYASLVYGTGMRLPGDTEADPSGALWRPLAPLRRGYRAQRRY